MIEVTDNAPKSGSAEGVGQAPKSESTETSATEAATIDAPPSSDAVAQGHEANFAQVEWLGIAEVLNVLRQERDSLKDKLLRSAADFENYKRRAKRDASDSVKQAEDKVVCDFLPVVDNLERAIDHAKGKEQIAEETTKLLLQGVEMVLKQFVTTLEKYGISAVDSVGKPFDPELHEAIQQVHSDQPKNTVVTVFQKGYVRNEKLVRPAMVVVSKGPASEEVSAPTSERESSTSDGIESSTS